MDYHAIQIDGNEVTLLNPDARIDLGGIAKGYIADRMKEFLNENGLHTMTVAKIGQAKPGILDVLQNNEVDIVINTMDHDQEKVSDGFVIRQTAIEHNIALLTSFDTVDALLKALENRSFSTTAL